MKNVIKKNIYLLNISLYLNILFTFIGPLYNIQGKSLVQIGFPFPYLTIKNNITQIPFLALIRSLNILSLILNILFFCLVIHILLKILNLFNFNKLISKTLIFFKTNKFTSKLKIKKNILYISIWSEICIILLLPLGLLRDIEICLSAGFPYPIFLINKIPTSTLLYKFHFSTLLFNIAFIYFLILWITSIRPRPLKGVSDTLTYE